MKTFYKIQKQFRNQISIRLDLIQHADASETWKTNSIFTHFDRVFRFNDLGKLFDEN